MLGDFNLSDTATKSINSPVDSNATSAQRHHYQPVFWRALFQRMLEITALATARRGVANV